MSKKPFDKLVDGGASYPQFAMVVLHLRTVPSSAARCFAPADFASLRVLGASAASRPPISHRAVFGRPGVSPLRTSLRSVSSGLQPLRGLRFRTVPSSAARCFAPADFASLRVLGASAASRPPTLASSLVVTPASLGLLRLFPPLAAAFVRPCRTRRQGRLKRERASALMRSIVSNSNAFYINALHRAAEGGAVRRMHGIFPNLRLRFTWRAGIMGGTKTGGRCEYETWRSRVAQRGQIDAFQRDYQRGRAGGPTIRFAPSSRTRGVVAVPDSRLDVLSEMYHPKNTRPRPSNSWTSRAWCAARAGARAWETNSLAHSRGGRHCTRGALL